MWNNEVEMEEGEISSNEDEVVKESNLEELCSNATDKTETLAVSSSPTVEVMDVDGWDNGNVTPV